MLNQCDIILIKYLEKKILYMKDNFKYKIVEHISTLSKNGDTTKELNKVSHNRSDPKYDIRNWKRTNNEEKLLKGITLNEEEMIALKEAIKRIQ